MFHQLSKFNCASKTNQTSTQNYFVFSALDFGEFKRFIYSIYQNLRELFFFLFYMLMNTALNPLGFINNYISIAFVD